MLKFSVIFFTLEILCNLILLGPHTHLVKKEKNSDAFTKSQVLSTLPFIDDVCDPSEKIQYLLPCR